MSPRTVLPSPAVPELVWTVVVAAGSGARFGGPKQFEELGGRRVLDWAVDAAGTASDGVVVVLPPDRARRWRRGGRDAQRVGASRARARPG